MQFETVKDIIKYAIAREIEAAEFYEDASQQEMFSGSREMLLEFVQQERKHQAMLEKLLEGGIDRAYGT